MSASSASWLAARSAFASACLRRFAALRLGRFRIRHAPAANPVAAPLGAAAAPSPGPALRLVVGLALRTFFLGDQRLPIGHRDLVVVGMDFAERQKTVAIAAIFDEGGLQRRFDPRYLGEIDVAAQLAAAR